MLSCLPGVSQAVQMALSCPPGASLVPLKRSFPASLVPCKLSKLFLPAFLCLAGASLVPHKLSTESFPASLVPLRLSKWSFPGVSQTPNGPFLPPWCLAGCPIDPFLPLGFRVIGRLGRVAVDDHMRRWHHPLFFEKRGGGGI